MTKMFQVSGGSPLRVTCQVLLFCFVLACTTEKKAGTNTPPTEKDISFAPLPTPKPGEAVATFAGGCFWSMEACFERLRGVRGAVCGYAGGNVPGVDTSNPTYEQVGTGQTGHAEAVQVYYNPKQITYQTLVKAFLAAHDPTTLNQQGPDRGTQYRSVAFYRTPAEKAAIDSALTHYDAHGPLTDPPVTQVVPFTAFYPAEVYHQGYYDTHPNSFYIVSVSAPKVEKFEEKMAAQLN
jgi:peptide-methionine (S)-S-oxide reductase